MRRLTFRKKQHLVFLLCVWCLVVDWSKAETEESEGGPMEKTEQAALYSTIQGFVGDSWNGSYLYPDPCGWTPIQVLNFSHHSSLISFWSFQEKEKKKTILASGDQ